MVFSQDKIRRSVLWSRSLTFLMNFKILSLIVGRQPHPDCCVMRLFSGFSHFRPLSEKLRSPSAPSSPSSRRTRRTPTSGWMNTAAGGFGRISTLGSGGTNQDEDINWEEPG